MESKITRYSAAAVVTLAAALVLFGPFGTSKSGSIVLADVAQKVSEMGNSILTGHRTGWYQGQEEPCLKADAIAYVSSKYGYMEEQHDADGNLTHRAYILKESSIPTSPPTTPKSKSPISSRQKPKPVLWAWSLSRRDLSSGGSEK